MLTWRSLDIGWVSYHLAVIMSPVITLVFLILGISALDIQNDKDWPRVPSFYPAGFPLMPSGNASTCQNLCKISAGCQYFVWMEGYGHQCSLIDKYEDRRRVTQYVLNI